MNWIPNYELGNYQPQQYKSTTKRSRKLQTRVQRRGFRIRSESQMVSPARPQFVLFGSSIVQQCFTSQGWGALLADLYDRKADIFVRGYSGWNSRLALQYLHRIFPKEADVQPSLVIVYFGGNDAMRPHPSGLGSHVPLPEYLENMRKIYYHIKSLSDKTRLIFLTSPPSNEEMIREHLGNALDNQERTNEDCRVYAEALVESCKDLDVKTINLWTAIQQHENWARACFTDGIHFTSQGSKVVAKEILKVLLEAEWEPSLYWMSMPTEFDEDSPYYRVHVDSKTTINFSHGIPSWKREFTKTGIAPKL